MTDDVPLLAANVFLCCVFYDLLMRCCCAADALLLHCCCAAAVCFVGLRRKGLGVLQVVALHAFDRCCSALWGPPATAAAEEGAPQKGGALTLRVLQVLQPFALSLQRQGALRAPLHHTRGPPVGPPFAATDLHGPLAAAGGGPPDTGGGLGFASRRLLEVITKDLEAPEVGPTCKP